MATRLDQQIEQLENIVEMVLDPAQNNGHKDALHFAGQSQTESLYQPAKKFGAHSLRDCCGEFISLIASRCS